VRRVLPVAGWGLWLAALAAAAVALGADPGELALVGGLAGAVVLAGTPALRSRPAPRRDVAGSPEAVPDESWATVAAGVGVVLAVWGAEVGAWLVGVGLGLLALGGAGLVREERARRRAVAGLPPVDGDEPPLRAPPPAPGEPPLRAPAPGAGEPPSRAPVPAAGPRRTPAADEPRTRAVRP
jgi:hypothetical protein